MSRRAKPNTKLPKGGKAVRPFKKQIAGWVEMTFDAKVQQCGVTWYRVKGGMGNQGSYDREDWVADLPAVCVSVHDYHWNGEDFGPDYGSFENACKQELIKAVSTAKHDLEKAKERWLMLEKSIDMLKELKLPAEAS